MTEEERKEWNRLCDLVCEKGFKPGFAAFKFKERFGRWPDKNLRDAFDSYIAAQRGVGGECNEGTGGAARRENGAKSAPGDYLQLTLPLAQEKVSKSDTVKNDAHHQLRRGGEVMNSYVICGGCSKLINAFTGKIAEVDKNGNIVNRA